MDRPAFHYSDGSIDSVSIGIDDLLSEPVTFESTLEQTAESVAKAIRQNHPDWTAYATGTVVTGRPRSWYERLWFAVRRYFRKLFRSRQRRSATRE